MQVGMCGGSALGAKAPPPPQSRTHWPPDTAAKASKYKLARRLLLQNDNVTYMKDLTMYMHNGVYRVAAVDLLIRVSSCLGQ